MRRGKKDTNGVKTWMRLYSENERKLARYAIYCRKCHHGLCLYIEAGALMKDGKILNVIFVDPCPNCGTGQVVEWPEHLSEEMGKPENAS